MKWSRTHVSSQWDEAASIVRAHRTIFGAFQYLTGASPGMRLVNLSFSNSLALVAFIGHQSKCEFFNVSHSDKTWVFDYSECAQGPIYVTVTQNCIREAYFPYPYQ